MHSFKFFTEKKAYSLNEKENAQVEKILKAYHTIFEPLQDKNPIPVIYKNKAFDREHGEFFLGNIQYFDPITKSEEKVKVVVNFEPLTGVRGAYVHDEKLIELFYYEFVELSENLKRGTIVHELLHAKQHYRKKSPAERRALHKRTRADGDVTVRSLRGYYLGATELPVQIASITHELDRQYNTILNNIKSGKNVKFWEHQRRGFLQLLERFLRASSIKGFPLPSYLNDQKSFIETLFRNKNNPKYIKYYRDFKTKLHFYYDKLRGVKVSSKE